MKTKFIIIFTLLSLNINLSTAQPSQKQVLKPNTSSVNESANPGQTYFRKFFNWHQSLPLEERAKMKEDLLRKYNTTEDNVSVIFEKEAQIMHDEALSLKEAYKKRQQEGYKALEDAKRKGIVPDYSH